MCPRPSSTNHPTQALPIAFQEQRIGNISAVYLKLPDLGTDSWIRARSHTILRVFCAKPRIIPQDSKQQASFYHHGTDDKI